MMANEDFPYWKNEICTIICFQFDFFFSNHEAFRFNSLQICLNSFFRISSHCLFHLRRYLLLRKSLFTASILPSSKEQMKDPKDEFLSIFEWHKSLNEDIAGEDVQVSNFKGKISLDGKFCIQMVNQ